MSTIPLKNVSVADTFFTKFSGLHNKKLSRSILLRTHFGIHTLLLKEPIDVVVLDKQNKVVALKKSLRPNRLYFWNPKYDRVLELPEGMITINKIRVGDIIGFPPTRE